MPPPSRRRLPHRARSPIVLPLFALLALPAPTRVAERLLPVPHGRVTRDAPASDSLAPRSRRVAPDAGDPVYEATLGELQEAMRLGRATSVSLVDAYRARIAAYDRSGPVLHAVIRLNPRARADAAALDAERAAGTVRGPLHGIPVLVKDNFGTRDMPTAAGSVALAALQLPDDAFQVRKLREAGAVILGKTNMHELAAGITSVSSLGGQTCNPYDPTRNPGGSSGGSGAAVAASLAALAWGSDTCGSIRIPSAVHNLVGLRPTKGLSSIAGIVPLSHTQDVGGPIARTVTDLAIALDATVGADPNDPATRILQGRPLPRFAAALDTTALRGKRLAVLTDYMVSDADDREGEQVVRAAIARMKGRGATILEVTIPGLDTLVTRAGVIDYEFKYDLVDFLARVPGAPVASLGDILRLGRYDIALEPAFRRRDSLGTRDSDAYRTALMRREAARALVTAFLDSSRVDALVYPTMRRKAAIIGEPPLGSTCQLSAVTGLPALSVPAGFTPDGLPIGVELLGRALADADLVAMAYDYEQSEPQRHAPSTTPPLRGGRAPAPSRFVAITRGNGMNVGATFVHDATQRTLDWEVRVSGASASRISAVALARDSAGMLGPVIRRLSAAGESRARGTVVLREPERRALAAGRLALAVFTTDRDGALPRAPLALMTYKARGVR